LELPSDLKPSRSQELQVKDALKIFNEISMCSSVECSLGFSKLSKALTQVTLSTQLKDMALEA
jgi:hypothetical protein